MPTKKIVIDRARIAVDEDGNLRISAPEVLKALAEKGLGTRGHKPKPSPGIIPGV